MVNLEYEEFVTYLFDHPEAENGKKWFYEDTFMALEIDANMFVGFASRIFGNIENIANSFSERQVCLGLEYLIDFSCSELCYNFLSNDVPAADRISAVLSMYKVFEVVFNRKCKAVVSHLEQKSCVSYNSLCYMWWDVFPRHGNPRSPEYKGMDDAILNVFKEILLLENIACKESALHGLGHWQSAYPDEVQCIIQENQISIPDSLIPYSKNVMLGNVV